jgi:hypothetical protein
MAGCRRHRSRSGIPADAQGRSRGDGRLSDRALAEIVKTYANRIGLDPALFNEHSLRAVLDIGRTTWGFDL